MDKTDTENDKPDAKEPRGPHPDLPNPIFLSILAYPHRPPTSPIYIKTLILFNSFLIE